MNAKSPLSFRYRFGTESEWREERDAHAVVPGAGFDGVLFHTTLANLPEYKAMNSLQRSAYSRSIEASEVERAAAAKADTITLRGAFRKELALLAGSLEGPFAALNECAHALMTHWNIDVEAHKTLTRPAAPVNLPEAGSMIAYPPMMVRKELEGVVNIRLAIDERGRVTGCHIQMPLSDPAFEESSCLDIQQALDFDPALDKDGRPIASYWLATVTFTLT